MWVRASAYRRGNTTTQRPAESAHLTRCRPQIWLGAESNLHEQIAQLYSSSERTPKLEHSVAEPEPSKHRGFERNLLPVI
eukprot:6709695-Prymnesium_polylepis.3